MGKQNAKLEYLGSKRVNPGKKGKTYIKYRCVCGKVTWMLQESWHKQKSCGCLTKQILREARTIHGHAFTSAGKESATYRTWCTMLQRCYYKKHKSYSDYGGRGITVCARWRESFVDFLADMGERPDGFLIGRIDNNGNYEPGNCRWETYTQQARNRRSSKLITFNGQTRTLEEWSETIGIRRDALGHRLLNGWSIERAITEPARYQKNSRCSFRKNPPHELEPVPFAGWI